MTELRSIAVSMLTVGVISLIPSLYVFTYISENKGFHACVVFITLTVLQLIIFNLFKKSFNDEVKPVIIPPQEHINEYNTIVSCALCGQSNEVNINLNTINGFKCTSCNKDNSVIINLTTCLKTHIIDTTDNSHLDAIDKIVSNVKDANEI